MNAKTISDFLALARSLYPDMNPVPLHAPQFLGREKEYLAQCIDSTYVSYVGSFVTSFEKEVQRRTGAAFAVAMVNGTAALQLALICAGVRPGDLVITQPLTFAATAAAIRHAGAEPVFVDVERSTLGMDPNALTTYLEKDCKRTSGAVHDRATSKRVAAVVPVHTFGHPARVAAICEICREAGIEVVEDAAESLGSLYRGAHTGTFGHAGILSFNGNKTITTGGGGMVLTSDASLAEKLRHLSTTAKRPHPWEFFHDAAGFNYRMPNINAAVGCAQLEYLDDILRDKRHTASVYETFFAERNVPFVREPVDCTSNYWLNCVLLENRQEREEFLRLTNENGVQTRPAWMLMPDLPPYKDCARGDLATARWLEERIVNIPSGPRLRAKG